MELPLRRLPKIREERLLPVVSGYNGRFQTIARPPTNLNMVKTLIPGPYVFLVPILVPSLRYYLEQRVQRQRLIKGCDHHVF